MMRGDDGDGNGGDDSDESNHDYGSRVLRSPMVTMACARPSEARLRRSMRLPNGKPE